jgi:hypothetical protein
VPILLCRDSRAQPRLFSVWRSGRIGVSGADGCDAAGPDAGAAEFL